VLGAAPLEVGVERIYREKRSRKIYSCKQVDVAFWPTASDIAARLNVGVQGNCGSGWRAFKSTLLTRLGSDECTAAVGVAPATNN
jgi:hypothetical protein